MTLPTITQPDLEAWVWAHVGDLAGVTSFAYSAAQLDMAGWIYSHSIQVDARASRKQAARDLAETVRQRLMALPSVDWPEGVVCYLQPSEGPSWLPDDDGGPRYMTRYEIRVHPRRDGGTVPLVADATHPPRRKAASQRSST